MRERTPRLLFFGVILAWTIIAVLVIAKGPGTIAIWDANPIDAAKAELIYREAVTAVRNREAETGEYFFEEDNIELVEQSLELKPGYVNALGVLAWVYSTYPEYLSDDDAHETALDYAFEFFKAQSESDVFAYEILGAAMFANGQFVLGQQLYDQAIQRAPTSEIQEAFRLKNANLLELHRLGLGDQAQRPALAIDRLPPPVGLAP